MTLTNVQIEHLDAARGLLNGVATMIGETEAAVSGLADLLDGLDRVIAVLEPNEERWASVTGPGPKSRLTG